MTINGIFLDILIKIFVMYPSKFSNFLIKMKHFTTVDAFISCIHVEIVILTTISQNFKGILMRIFKAIEYQIFQSSKLENIFKLC